MNKQQKEVLQSQLNDEKKVLNKIKGIYKKALDDVDTKIAALKGRTDTENLQSIIYQIDYQNALKKQISGILDTMNGEQFTTISEYLSKCYDEGFLGTMYDLQKQGIPLVFPIDQTQVVKAIQLDTKLSKKLYTTLGEDINLLKQRISNNLSRGIAQGSSYADIARNIKGLSSVPMNNAMRISRTEGHRITQAATFDAQQKAKESGADIVKQWDSTMDKRTRPHHAQLDGQIRELDEPFDVAGRQAMFPGGFGVPAEDIHCRCVSLQRARWALDEDELETLKKRAEYFGLDKTDSFEEYKTKYIKAVEIDPNEGKVFHMKPDGTFEEGGIPGKDKYHVNGLTGEVTELEKGIDYSGEVLSMNDDGTYSFGKVKNAAQYKVNVENSKVLNVDVTKSLGNQDFVDMFANSGEIAKYDVVYDSLPDDLAREFDLEYAKVGDPKLALKQALKNKGYDAIHVLNKSGETQDLISEYLDVVDDSLVKKTKKSKLETLTSSLATQHKKLAKIDDKTYSGIWKDDVKVSDYSAKKGSIQGKRDYYLQQIASGTLTPAQAAQYQKYLDDLDEFEKLGAEYEAISGKITKIKGEIKKFTPKPASTSSTEAFTQDRKDAAYWFTNDNGSTKAADGILRDKSGEVWRNASQHEQDGIYGYTSGSGAWNRPLSGFEKPWSRSGTGWESEFYKGVNQVWIDYEGKGDAIRAATNIIDRSEYDFDIWLQRGCKYNAMESFFGVPFGTLASCTESELQQFVGHHNRIYGFVSTSVSKGKGFSGEVIMNIYAPRGSKMMYAEPFSAFGQGGGSSWDGISKQSYFGSESEMILQRGGSYTVTKIEKKGSTMYVDVEVHPEDGYDLIQQDPNEWKGSKNNYHS